LQAVGRRRALASSAAATQSSTSRRVRRSERLASWTRSRRACRRERPRSRSSVRFRRHRCRIHPGRFQLASPLKGSGLASVAATAAQSLLMPTCEGAIMTANARDSSMNRYGEATTFFACLMPYRDGYALNVYTTFTKASGRVQLGGARSDVDASSHWRQRAVHPPDDRLHGRGDQADRGERQPAGGRIPDAPTAGGDLPMFRWTLNADVA